MVSATVININRAVSALPAIVLALETGFLMIQKIRSHKRRHVQRHFDPYE